MSNITAYPLQDGFETTLAQSWNGAIGTVYLNTAPSFTFPSGVKTYIVVNPGKTNMQVGEIDSLHVGNKTVNVSSISVGSGAGTTYTQQSHSVGSTVIISDNYQFWKNIVDAVNSKMDLSGGTFTGDVSFSGTGTEFRLPNLTTAERLALTPGNGTIVYDSTLGENYQYIAGAWNAFAAGSTQPNASETVAGKVEEATQTQLNNGDATGETGARLFTNPSKLPTAVASYVTNNAGVNAAVKAEALEVIDDEGVESIVDRDTYLLGEPAAAGDSLFVEDMVTFASATQVQAIGDVTANTRVSIPVIGSGVASNTLKLALKKFVSPGVDLGVRIETDNAGEPSGTAVTNGTATVTEASLTTSLVDTTVTLAGSVTLTEGTKYHIVLFAGTYGSETINGTNYFGVGFKTQNTNTRAVNLFNGTNWDTTPVVNTDANGISLPTSINFGTLSTGFKVQAKANLYVSKITKNSISGATRASVKNNAGTILAQVNFSGDIATFPSPVYIPNGDFFRVEVDSTSSYTTRYNGGSGFYPVVGTHIDYISGSNAGADDTRAFNIVSVETTVGVLNSNDSFVYTSSDLFNSKLLSLTDATYSYKLPTDIPRIATESKGTGQNVIATTLGFNDNFSGLTPLADYYLSNTPGAISMTAGTNFYTIGSSIDANTLYVNPQDVGYGNSFVITSSNTEVTTLSTSLVKVKEILCNKSFTFNVYFEIKINSNPSICTGRIYVNGVAVGTSRTNNTSIYVGFEEYITVSKGDLIQIYMSTNNGAQTASLQNFRLRGGLIQPQGMNNVVNI